MLPLHEEVQFEQYRRAIQAAEARDLESLKKLALQMLGYAKANRAMLHMSQQQLLTAPINPR